MRYTSTTRGASWRVVALVSVGPAILAGAGVDMIGRLQGRYRVLPLVMLPLGVVGGLALAAPEVDGVARWGPVLSAAAVTALALAVIDLPPRDRLALRWRWVAPALLALIWLVVVIQPTGLELTGAWLGWPADTRHARRWAPDPAHVATLATQVATQDPDGAGAYLETELATSGPFRYLAYGGVGHPDGGPHARSYMDRRFDPHAQALLVNGRPLFLGLYEVQGYDPIQLERYVAFIRAINDKGQDYHTAFVSDEGVDSPLFDLLNVRYLVVDASLPLDRADVVTLTAGFEVVARTERVVIYARGAALPHAWIVHDVRRVEPDTALPLLVAGAVAPYQTALVEHDIPAVAPVADPQADRAEVRGYGADRITIAVETTAPGLLIVSEIFADGWRAYVDGTPTAIVPVHHALRGVPLPAGDRIVEMRYEPTALRAGLWISGGTGALMVMALTVAWWPRVRRRQ